MPELCLRPKHSTWHVLELPLSPRVAHLAHARAWDLRPWLTLESNWVFALGWVGRKETTGKSGWARKTLSALRKSPPTVSSRERVSRARNNSSSPKVQVQTRNQVPSRVKKPESGLPQSSPLGQGPHRSVLLSPSYPITYHPQTAFPLCFCFTPAPPTAFVPPVPSLQHLESGAFGGGLASWVDRGSISCLLRFDI